jgi:hypothetical protein
MSRILGEEVDAEFIADTEARAGKPFGELTRSDLEHFIQLDKQRVERLEREIAEPKAERQRRDKSEITDIDDREALMEEFVLLAASTFIDPSTNPTNAEILTAVASGAFDMSAALCLLDDQDGPECIPPLEAALHNLAGVVTELHEYWAELTGSDIADSPFAREFAQRGDGELRDDDT